MTGSKSSGSIGSHQRRQHKRALWRSQSGLCHWCRKPMDKTGNHANSATLDHVIPRSLGGVNARKNLVLAHGKCNNDRSKPQ